MPDGESLKIGDITQATGLTADTVRFYEKEGLLGTVRRTSGIRRYDEGIVRRLDFVRKAVGLGFSLAEIRGLLSLRVSSRTSCGVMREQALRKLADVEQRLVELQQIRDALAQLATTCGTTSASAPCPFLDALDLPVESTLPARTRKRVSAP